MTRATLSLTRRSPLMICGLLLAMTPACGGIPVNINGKTVILGGGDDAPAQGAQGAQGVAGTKGPSGLLSPLKKDGAATTITIKKGDEQPLIKRGGAVTGDVLDAQEAGFKACSSYGVILSRPAATLVVEQEQLLTLTLREEGQQHGLLLVTPEGHYVCRDAFADGVSERFPAGTYQVYPAWSVVKPKGLNARKGQSGTMNVELEVRTLARQTPAPELTVGASTPNPHKLEPIVYTGGYHKADKLGFKSCPSYNTWITSTPVMKVTFEDKRRMVLGVQGTERLLMVWPDGRYNCEISTRELTSFEPGTYSFHAFASDEVGKSGGVSTFEPLFYDESAPITIQGQIPTHTLSSLDSPLVLKVQTQAQRLTRARGCERGATFGAQPDLYLALDRPIEDLRVLLVEGKKGQDGLVIQDVTTRELTFQRERSCGESMRPSLSRADGRYAIFLGHAGQARQLHLIVTAKQTQIDPYLATQAPAAELPLEQRVVSAHYPLMDQRLGGQDMQERAMMWERTPRQLWAYAAKGLQVNAPSAQNKALTKPADLTLEPGEPLIVRAVTAWRKDGSPFKLRVLTADLWSVEVEAADLTTQAPAALTLPKAPRSHEAIAPYDASKVADERATRAGQSFQKAETTYQACFDAYWDKHGGSDAKHLVRVTRDQRGSITKVKNLGDEIAERADRACGASKLDPMEAAYHKELVRSFEAWRAAHLKKMANAPER